eukprot:365247-Chlamydomonas_euryale.AAC.7
MRTASKGKVSRHKVSKQRQRCKAQISKQRQRCKGQNRQGSANQGTPQSVMPLTPSRPPDVACACEPRPCQARVLAL